MNLSDTISAKICDDLCDVQTLEIEVLDEDIQKGDQDDCHQCALARAIKRRVAPYFKSYVSVGSQSFSMGIAASQPLPPECVDWIKRFDDGEKVEPFRFQITLPTYFVTGKFD